MLYYFKHFTFDTGTFQLLSHGRIVPLGNVPSRILHHLLQNHGRVVRRQQIPHTGADLPDQIEAIRNALGNRDLIRHLRHPRMGEGYFLAATVTHDLKGAGQEDSHPASGPLQRIEDGLWEPSPLSGDRKSDCVRRLYDAVLEIDPVTVDNTPGARPAPARSAMLGWTETPSPAIDVARQHAEQALRLDPEDAFAHYCMGRVYTLLGAYEPAITALELSRKLTPCFVFPYFGLGFTKLWFGAPEDAIENLRDAIDRSPYDPATWAFQAVLGTALWMTGAHEEADDMLVSARRFPDADFWPAAIAAAHAAELGQPTQARDAMNEMRDKRPDISVEYIDRLLVHASERLRQPLLSGLNAAGN